jgi:hypothetical protein
MFYCVYCGVDRPDYHRSIEHPLSQAIGGGGWSTREVCGECNQFCGREIDRPFAEDSLVRAVRHRFEIPDSRGQIPPAPRLYGQMINDESRAELELGREGPKVRRLPQPVSGGPGKERYIVERGEGKRIAELRAERIRRDLPAGFEVVTRIDSVELPEDDAEVELSVSTDLWPRMGAKLALGLGFQGLDDTWARGEWAGWLRGILRGSSDPAPDTRVRLRVLPKAIGSDDHLVMLANPPHHTVFFVGDDPLCLMIHLFGIWRYVGPLGPATPRDRPAWEFDPRRRSARETAFIELAVAGAERFAASKADT